MSDAILAFLTRISYPLTTPPTPPPPTLETLFTLHRCLQTSIPYENLSVFHPPSWSVGSGWFDPKDGEARRETRPIQIGVERVYRKMVLERRGGFCLELNGIELCEVWLAFGLTLVETSERKGYRHFCFFEDVDRSEEYYEVMTDFCSRPETCPPVPGMTEFVTMTGEDEGKLMLLGRNVAGGDGVAYKFFRRDRDGVEFGRKEFGGVGKVEDWESGRKFIEEVFGIKGYGGEV
ncbi:hypothetical protein HDU67_006115 [Dinochytrium kinnereticum]|nr:hypothetical protein HDU67_006115 [Dinochytrium kinnereticum]